MRKIIKTTLICLVICIIFLLLQKVYLQSPAEAVKTVCNTFFCVGVFTLCLAGILFCSDNGAFDIFGYSFSLIGSTFKKDITDRKYKNYPDYKEAKHKANKKSDISSFLIAGLVITLIGLVFLIIYGKISG